MLVRCLLISLCLSLSACATKQWGGFTALYIDVDAEDTWNGPEYSERFPEEPPKYIVIRDRLHLLIQVVTSYGMSRAVSFRADAEYGDQESRTRTLLAGSE